VIVAVLVVTALILAGGGTWWWLTQRGSTDEPRDTPTVRCTTATPTPPKKLPPPSAVQVAVLNGTDRAGLAISTADALALRGFDVVAIGNATRPVRSGVGVIAYGSKGVGAAVQLASYLPGASLQLVESRKGAGVDLRLGPEFDTVSTDTQAKRDLDQVTLPPLPPRCRTVGTRTT
jgi:hypothetical protein